MSAAGAGRTMALAVLALAAALVLGVLLGTEPVSLSRALADPSSLDATILFSLRPRRVALAALAGAGLCTVGGAYQALLRNPLAEPFVLGVSGGAALGATTVIALGLGVTTFLGAALVPAAAFAGGLGATALVYAIARGSDPAGSATSILLAGVMVNAIASALITFTKTLVPPSRATQLLRWLTGFIDLPTTPSLIFAAVYVTLACAVLIADAGRLNLLALGDEPARALGVDTARLERRVFIAGSVIVGAIVTLTGLIGFIGLLVPHMVRRWLGPDQRVALPVTAIGGAALLVVFDLAARLSFRVLFTEPPVGAITALVGGPLFLVLLRRGAARGP